ncbi:putative undecaprenyl pyrophosphate protein [Apodospora peruviana]|uniref:tRNA (guanine(37)-N1)-methyltransferase n=1 Tax=Apodospora peruviana TaxID=516989 RepID=A0AAE0ITD9_9PEZI|nr:putative undecaprenyl pyrophosphate protein [Apodospora peruviana]
MAFNIGRSGSPVEAYRQDAKLGGNLLTPEERLRLLKPYLPPPRSDASRVKAQEKAPRFGARRWLKKQFHMLVFITIHTFFSLYLKIRHAYHAVVNRVYSVLHHHHRTPQLIQRDVNVLNRLPKHLSVILTLENDGRGGAGIQRLIDEAADIVAWCASAGISQLSIYEKSGTLKGYLPETHRAVSEKLAAYFGPYFPALTMGAPHMPSVSRPASPRAADVADGCAKHLSILLLSAEDGRDSLVDLTKTLTEMSQRSKISSADISMELIDAELSESVMGEPDLLILFGPHVELAGYPPWQVRLTEIFHVQDNQGVGYQVFYRGLCSIKPRMRLARTNDRGGRLLTTYLTMSHPDEKTPKNNSIDDSRHTREEAIRMSLLHPPIVRTGAGALNRALFTKKVDLAAATVQDPRLISKYRKVLADSKALLRQDRISPVVTVPEDKAKGLLERGRKCLLLAPGVDAKEPDTWGPVLKEAVEKKELDVIPYELELGYDYWSHQDIMMSILPEELSDDIPTGFNVAGHVAHLNLRERYLPYKKVIAEVLLDKNPQIRTVINKIDNVGGDSVFRTFQYEVLAGPDDMAVQVSESGCVFEFDYAKVYWNSRLESEHRRLVDLFRPGEVVCDVMAGIGPFAVPAGKKGVFVWANDMNPESYHYLQQAIKTNKVGQFVRPLCEDGREFIHKAAKLVLVAAEQNECALIPGKPLPRTKAKAGAKAPEPTRIPVPATISHFVMNLPASAIEFLGCYRGLYAGQEDLFALATARKLPMVHVHCFSYKADDETPLNDICARMTKELGYAVKPGDPENEGEVAIHDVRDVAPSKRMFCASFRLPKEVAFDAGS